MKCAVLFVALLASVQAAEVFHGKHGRRVEQTIKVIHTFSLPNSLSKGDSFCNLMIFVANFQLHHQRWRSHQACVVCMTSGYDLARNASPFRALYDMEFFPPITSALTAVHLTKPACWHDWMSTTPAMHACTGCAACGLSTIAATMQRRDVLVTRALPRPRHVALRRVQRSKTPGESRTNVLCVLQHRVRAHTVFFFLFHCSLVLRMIELKVYHRVCVGLSGWMSHVSDQIEACQDQMWCCCESRSR